MRRRGKQAVIISIYLIILILLGTGIFFGFFYTEASCTDGRQNQDETGIDCGGKCSQYCLADLASRPLVISEVESLAYGATSSDALGKVKNQNAKAALRSAKYTFTAYGSGGEVVATQGGKFSLLPLEERTVVALGLAVSAESITKTELTVSEEEWVAFTDFTEPPNIYVVNLDFQLLSGQAGYAEVKGLVQNKSPYDVRSLGVVVVVQDGAGKPLSVNRTMMNTIVSGEERDFRLVWPQSFIGIPADAEAEVHFDMLAEDAFVQQYFPGGDFQSLDPQR